MTATKEIVSSNLNPISLKLIIITMMMSNDEACHKVMAMIREVKLQIRDTYVAVYRIDLQLKWHIANKIHSTVIVASLPITTH